MEVIEFSLALIVLMLLSAFFTAILHGATGMAGGIVLAAILSHLIGIKLAVPVVTCSLAFSHASRAYLYIKTVDWRSVRIVLMFSLPTIAFGALLFTYLSSTLVALMMAGFLAASLPIKYWAKRRQLHASNSVLAGASVLWGMLAGNVIGPGFVLAPFLQGRGMDRLTFVGSLACIVLVMNLVKLSVFGTSTLLDASSLWLGILLGIVTIPGNWVGKKMLHNVSDDTHRQIVNAMTILLVFNFLYLALG
ncbi:sulfite exporter TauE/SafE family protein [Arenicella xantha]|uniref:Probable membrane transporter protein n=1 Tax=Arenicella xantha TaxID=644221 RepID=A0A395JPB9_9GAMM|nr:sulfite exporter TauE/SafE family protein [Arenicella xantha]RBP51637.1 sulfite exporter TauE/SafE [Arenicella xantha]